MTVATVLAPALAGGVAAAALVLAGCTVDPDTDTNARHHSTPTARTSSRPAGTGVTGPGPPVTRPEWTRPGTTEWRADRPAEHQEIQGFTTRAGAPPGTPLVLKVSTAARSFRAGAYRIGAYRGGTSRLVWRSGWVAGTVQPQPRFAAYRTRTIEAPWRTSLIADTYGWPPGFYVLRLTTRSGTDFQVPYVVSSRSSAGTVVLGVPVLTWQAYNLWGGYSLYASLSGDQRAHAVSFDRPYFGVNGFNDFRTSVVPLVVRSEATHVPLSYVANVQLDRRPGLLAGARAYVSLGHDEYWTPGIRRAVQRARARGTNLAFLGANTAYWRVRLGRTGTGPDRLVVGYRSDAVADPALDTSPAEATARFRDPPAAHPENSLTGMLYECYPADADYTVVSPRWWGFRGTGVRAGSSFPMLVGNEADRVYPGPASPRRLQVLSHAPYVCRGVPTTSQSVWFTTASGAGVFTAGTLRWGCAVWDVCDKPLGRRTQEFVRRVTANVLHGLARGPAGRLHPARPNVGAFDLPRTNSVPAS
ncbi:N,N-dimethylformamidase beta subunit family domain-containing protein [Nocardioides marmoribigeumensis]|uniref:N,N-dimethylformamidase beta subunit-like C-terminal domain-containing protein n=1 Tax=Nocardioides marmoribigeumensis TaxID=433649 RepID=A0ABU2BR54_9ACTN|nr:N,N-dimethylformamidase beta subunit family domain-containing protein [Nocardioides marmoribigeumensis]MDR7360746.1 hypothetical protein [Nocardioides marmoribigeumensis]